MQHLCLLHGHKKQLKQLIGKTREDVFRQRGDEEMIPTGDLWYLSCHPFVSLKIPPFGDCTVLQAIQSMALGEILRFGQNDIAKGSAQNDSACVILRGVRLKELSDWHRSHTAIEKVV